MKKIGVAVLIVVCVLLLAMMMSGTQENCQTTLESKIPARIEDAQEENAVIRVLLKTNGFSGIAHTKVSYQVDGGKTKTITPDDKRFDKGTIRIQSEKEHGKVKLVSLKRGYGTPSYRGTLELYATAEGIVIVNELLLEDYLRAVVPSEMPATYELEALKSQAVCARSYAYNQSREYSYPQYRAHVDDSTSFQVYGNSKEQKRTDQAVKETAGEKIWYAGRVATAYYYSTSCGKSAGITAWGGKETKKNQYLKSVSVCNEKGIDYEKNLPWYRWSAKVSEKQMSDLIELNTGKEIGKLRSLKVTKTGAGGIAQEVTAVGTTDKVIVQTENKIRAALGGGGYTIRKQDGSKSTCAKLLPSAFFTIKKVDGNYMISGGGYGHGIGMSQNGANEMAKQGHSYKEILCFFYSGVKVR